MTIRPISIENPIPLTGAGVRFELHDCARTVEKLSSPRKVTDAFDRAIEVLEAVREDKHNKKIFGFEYGGFRHIDVDEEIQKVEKLRKEAFAHIHTVEISYEKSE